MEAFAAKTDWEVVPGVGGGRDVVAGLRPAGVGLFVDAGPTRALAVGVGRGSLELTAVVVLPDDVQGRLVDVAG